LINASDLIFTVVRDPVATALAAFCEIDLRGPSYRSRMYRNRMQYQARYEAVSCERCPTCRYQAFSMEFSKRSPCRTSSSMPIPRA